jgi:hypothetical protein
VLSNIWASRDRTLVLCLQRSQIEEQIKKTILKTAEKGDAISFVLRRMHCVDGTLCPDFLATDAQGKKRGPAEPRLGFLRQAIGLANSEQAPLGGPRNRTPAVREDRPGRCLLGGRK